jgi:HSF-type DNA-binding
MMHPLTNTSESLPGHAMDITSPSSTSMGPPSNSSPELDQGNNGNGSGENNAAMHTGTGPAAVAAAQGPKVVQTAFIHKLYNMLEDRSIQHLISWSNTNESFVVSPSNEFSKVLAQYFKHTNISSFVRQLNMYGFHKVSDVFHGGPPDSASWEFRHGNGNFKKGDLVGLRDIKRRASRQALIHRDSFSGHKTMPPQPGIPAEPPPDTLEQRMVHMERAVYHINQRVSRTDDSLAMLSLKCQALTEGLIRCHQVATSNSLIEMILTTCSGATVSLRMFNPCRQQRVHSMSKVSPYLRICETLLIMPQCQICKRRLPDSSKSSAPLTILTMPF